MLKCPICKGWGRTNNQGKPVYRSGEGYICRICGGTGKVLIWV